MPESRHAGAVNGYTTVLSIFSLVSRLARWCEMPSTFDDAVRRSALLDRYCAGIGRDPASITLPVSYDRPQDTRDAIDAAVAAGFRHVVLGLDAPYPPDVARWVADEVITVSGGGGAAAERRARQ